MKKILLASFFIIVAIGFMACEDGIGDDRSWEEARVEVTVKNSSNVPIVGEFVYLFRDLDPDEDTSIGNANKAVVTDENGVAEFQLNFEELNIASSVTRFYFSVYKEIEDDIFLIKNEDYITVEPGDVKRIELILPDEI